MSNLSIKPALLLSILAVLPQSAHAQIQILSITSSANFVPGQLLPGSLASIFCTGLQDISGLTVAQGYPLPRTLAGVKVTVNGTDAPMLAIAEIAAGSYQQINVQIPWGTNFTTGLSIGVSQKAASAQVTTFVNNPWPVFFIDSSGYAVAQHSSDYRLVTPSDPARPGEWIVVYATNLGPVQNQPADLLPALPGLLAPIVPDTSRYLLYYGLAIGPSASYASTHIQSNYIGMSPGSIVNQVNLLVPNSQGDGELVFQLVKIYDCGFFFTQDCGRGFTTKAASMAAKLPVAR